MTRLLFVDPNCPAPYSRGTLASGTLGGTEATVVRIAESLDATVIQHNRTVIEERYAPFWGFEGIHPDSVVVVRNPNILLESRRRFPTARHYLWVHDRLRPGSSRSHRLAAALRKWGNDPLTIICVSDFQRRGVETSLARLPTRQVVARTIHNPIDDTLHPEPGPVDSSKLLFLSAPSKGLRFSLEAFQSLHRRMPDLRLRVANPGYQQDRPRSLAGVEWLGSLPHHAIIDELRTALCVFYPNFVVEETFGLVLAEANAVGTPVLTHDFGAAREVLGDPSQILPISWTAKAYEATTRKLPDRVRSVGARLAEATGLFDRYAATIASWREGHRPVVGPNPKFRLTAVTAAWRQLLSER